MASIRLESHLFQKSSQLRTVKLFIPHGGWLGRALQVDNERLEITAAIDIYHCAICEESVSKEHFEDYPHPGAKSEDDHHQRYMQDIKAFYRTYQSDGYQLDEDGDYFASGWSEKEILSEIEQENQ